jgi:hypothetical protein
MTDRELMQQALHAFESGRAADRADVMIALRERLAQPEPEPFEYWNAVEGWVKIDEVRNQFGSVGCGTIYKTAGEDRVPLYTAPPQRKLLTDEEIADEWEHVTGHNISHGDRQECRAMYISPDEVAEFARAVIAKVTGRKE